LLSNPNTPDYRHFRDMIRSYNSAVSFASMGAKIVEFPGGGPYVFKVHGQVYHRTSHVRTLNAEPPTLAQLYVVDSTQATEFRRNHPANEQCSAQILDQVDRFFRQHNRLADTYRMLRDVETQAILNANATGKVAPV
ncbi:hypothetical protein CBL_21367, partial [Carabus blaptoides fortunei]